MLCNGDEEGACRDADGEPADRANGEPTDRTDGAPARDAAGDSVVLLFSGEAVGASELLCVKGPSVALRGEALRRNSDRELEVGDCCAATGACAKLLSACDM